MIRDSQPQGLKRWFSRGALSARLEQAAEKVAAAARARSTPQALKREHFFTDLRHE